MNFLVPEDLYGIGFDCDGVCLGDADGDGICDEEDCCLTTSTMRRVQRHQRQRMR